VILVRHASAGDPATWEGPDRERPLDGKGERQARDLVKLLEAFPVSEIHTSPAVRCIETARPIAEARGLALVLRAELAEDRYMADGASVVEQLAGTDALVCGHGGLESALVGAPKWHKAEAFVVDGSLGIVEKLRPS
jgi:8-oxo-dGTP diphosphatase